VKAFRAVRASIVVAAAAGVLVLSGCGTANTAAIVNGTRISERDAQVAVQQVHQAQPDSTLDTPNAVASLIMAQFINQVANASGKGLSDSAAAAAVPQIVNPTPTTLELVKASLAWSQLTSAEQTEAVNAAAKADITLNPRYGTFNAKRIQFEKSAPNWLKASRTATGG
jgi:hypothetical protein